MRIQIKAGTLLLLLQLRYLLQVCSQQSTNEANDGQIDKTTAASRKGGNYQSILNSPKIVKKWSLSQKNVSMSSRKNTNIWKISNSEHPQCPLSNICSCLLEKNMQLPAGPTFLTHRAAVNLPTYRKTSDIWLRPPVCIRDLAYIKTLSTRAISAALLLKYKLEWVYTTTAHTTNYYYYYYNWYYNYYLYYYWYYYLDVKLTLETQFMLRDPTFIWDPGFYQNIWLRSLACIRNPATTLCLKKQSKLFLEWLCWISTNIDNFWHKNGQGDIIMYIYHLT